MSEWSQLRHEMDSVAMRHEFEDGGTRVKSGWDIPRPWCLEHSCPPKDCPKHEDIEVGMAW